MRSSPRSTPTARRAGLAAVLLGLVLLVAPWSVGSALAADALPDTTDPAAVVTEPASDPVTAPVADPATEPAIDPATDPATDPVVQPADPSDGPATDPVAGPAPDPVAVAPAVPDATPAAPSLAAEEPVPTPPEGVAITVNGLPMTGEEGGKIAECTISVAVAGLPDEADPATSIGVVIKAVPPMTPEGSPVTLVNQQSTTTATTWSGDFPMDALVAPFTPHGNGYHLRVLVSINGTLAGSSIYWLGCGEPQTGNPTRILFAVDWHAYDGTVSTDAPVGLLPEGWQDAFALGGTSKKGTAECTYAAGSGVLECMYDNPGHGDQPGLVVPGNPEATYEVGVAGVPEGWSANPSTLGTFVGRETCPRGHEGEDGHDGEEPSALAGGGSGDDGKWVCTHTVTLVQAPAPVVPPVTEPTAQVEATAVTAQPLAMTGASPAGMVWVGSALVLLGTLLLGWSVRPLRRSVAGPSRTRR